MSINQVSPKLQKILKSFGDGWTLSAIFELSESPQRFCQLQKSLNEINPATLTKRLRFLEKEKIVIRKKETIDKLSVSYELTEKGRKLVPVVKSLIDFAEKHYQS